MRAIMVVQNRSLAECRHAAAAKWTPASVAQKATIGDFVQTEETASQGKTQEVTLAGALLPKAGTVSDEVFLAANLSPSG
jgi:hypothetical protein